MNPFGKAQNVRLISKVSSLYYNYDLTQQEIANRLRLSRPKVSRLLKQAKELNIVQVTVKAPEGAFLELENQLETKFNLKEAIVTEVDLPEENHSESILKRQLGQAAADYLHRSIADNDVIGVTWGTTLQAMIDRLQPKPVKGVHVVQALGAVGPPEAKAHATDISRRLSQLLGSTLTLLHAPAVVHSSEVREALLSDPRVKKALDQFHRINVAYVGLGAMNTNPVLQSGSAELPEGLKKELMNSDAIGDIGLNFFNIDGEEVVTSLKDLFFGITLDELREVDTVVGIAGGCDKLQTIRGALNGRLVDVLITDQHTAEKLCSE